MRQADVRPVTLAVAPGTATTPGYPGSLARWLGGFHVRAYLGQAAFPPPSAFAALSCCAVVGAVACPAHCLLGIALRDSGGASPASTPSYRRMPEAVLWNVCSAFWNCFEKIAQNQPDNSSHFSKQTRNLVIVRLDNRNKIYYYHYRTVLSV